MNRLILALAGAVLLGACGSTAPPMKGSTLIVLAYAFGPRTTDNDGACYRYLSRGDPLILGEIFEIKGIAAACAVIDDHSSYAARSKVDAFDVTQGHTLASDAVLECTTTIAGTTVNVYYSDGLAPSRADADSFCKP